MTNTLTDIDPPGAEELRHQLAYSLAVSDGIRTPRWRSAFETVPRHVFVPEFTTHGRDGTIRRYSRTDPHRRTEWLTAAYSDDSLITLRDTDGIAISSSSQPWLMARMLEMLDVRDGHRVLEIGTGTGYNAALLAHALGEEAVTSVDVDPDLVAAARARLEACGYRPTLAVGDGLAGWPERASYDGIIATCGIRRIPRTWLGQVRPGGIIVANIGRGLIALRVAEDGYAEGRYTMDNIGFMPARPAGVEPPPTAQDIYSLIQDTDGRPTRSTTLFGDMHDDHFEAVAALTSPDLEAIWSEQDGWYAVADATGSWARADKTVGGATVTQHGRPLWDGLETAHAWWTKAGRPPLQQLGLTTTPNGAHTLWVGEPGHHALPLP